MKAIIYARVSSLGDRQNTERQISDLKQYAVYQNLEISRIFEEKIYGVYVRLIIKNDSLNADF